MSREAVCVTTIQAAAGSSHRGRDAYYGGILRLPASSLPSPTKVPAQPPILLDLRTLIPEERDRLQQSEDSLLQLLLGRLAPLAISDPRRFGLAGLLLWRPVQKPSPPQLLRGILPAQSHLYSHLRDGIHNPIK